MGELLGKEIQVFMPEGAGHGEVPGAVIMVDPVSKRIIAHGESQDMEQYIPGYLDAISDLGYKVELTIVEYDTEEYPTVVDVIENHGYKFRD